uniref:RUN domain-containing protein n=1 Tax=Neogobius melanostomus TaxID=47308 RepID=A0A8C6SQ15_9GOBI
MLATQMPETLPDGKDVKQIKDKLVQSLKALQKRYVTSEAVVTSDDANANLLCCALEAVFIHGIRSKFIRAENRTRGTRKEKGLPQPAFWSLLKTVTHRDVITELEKLNFVATEVGRCRAWLRLALNHGLLECYLVSLFREESELQAHYQPSALLLNPEEREVLLSYLQGLSSLTFDLSYKSAVLKEWTTTPLALAGLCPMAQLDALEVTVNGDAAAKTNGSQSWDTVSQTSSSSDALDLQKECPTMGQRESDSSRTALSSSNLSLDTTDSSHLSSSLSSDSLLQGEEPRSPPAEQSSVSDLDIAVNICTKRPSKDTLTKRCETEDNFSQDSMQEDSFVSSVNSDNETHEAPIENQANTETSLIEPAPPSPEPLSYDENQDPRPSSETKPVVEPSLDQAPHPTPMVEFHCSDEEERPEPVPTEDSLEPEHEDKTPTQESLDVPCPVIDRQHSESLAHSRSWISDDDIYKPQLEEVPEPDQDDTSVPSPQNPEPSALGLLPPPASYTAARPDFPILSAGC